MRRAFIVNDGLWRCLCPSFERAALQRAVLRPEVTASRQATSKPTTTRAARYCQYSTGASFAQNADRSDIDIEPSSARVYTSDHARQELDDSNKELDHLLSPIPPTGEQLSSQNIDVIKGALLVLRGSKARKLEDDMDRHSRILQLVTHLLRSRGQRLTAFEYESVMDAMAEPSGSAKGISKIMGDMEAHGIKPTATICKSALDALMNHPDYYTRDEILHIMRQSWFPIDTPTKQSVIVGMLRDEQYELAYSRLMEMVAEGARVETWVYDIFILVFGKMRFVDEMMAILNERKKLGSDAMDGLECFALDLCGETFHYGGVVTCWNKLVRTGKTQPSDGLLENVLATASKHGDAELATEVLDMLSRRTKTRDYHYEAVADAFAHRGDVVGAMRILCIMETTGILVQRKMLSEFSTALKSDPEELAAAEDALWEFRKSSTLPRELVASVLSCKAESAGSRAAMSLLQSVGELCGAAPSWRVLQDMILYSQDEETTRALCALYGPQHCETDEARSQIIYGKLILQSLAVENLDLAFHFARRFVSDCDSSDNGNIKNLAWVQPLVEAAVRQEDKRIWPVIDELLESSHGAAARNIRTILHKSRVSGGM